MKRNQERENVNILKDMRGRESADIICAVKEGKKKRDFGFNFEKFSRRRFGSVSVKKLSRGWIDVKSGAHGYAKKERTASQLISV